MSGEDQVPIIAVQSPEHQGHEEGEWQDDDVEGEVPVHLPFSGGGAVPQDPTPQVVTDLQHRVPVRQELPSAWELGLVRVMFWKNMKFLRYF